MLSTYLANSTALPEQVGQIPWPSVPGQTSCDESGIGQVKGLSGKIKLFVEIRHLELNVLAVISGHLQCDIESRHLV